MRKLSILICVMLATCGIVYAVDWGDSFTITLAPAGDRGVIIDTTAINVGDLAANATIDWGFPVPVISTGSIAPIEYTIKGATSTPTSTLSTDGTLGENKFALYVLFQSTKPASAQFTQGGANLTTNLVTFSAKQVGDTDSSNTNFEGDQTATGVDMDNLGLNVTRNLWFQLKGPTSWTTGVSQTVTVTITAEPAN